MELCHFNSLPRLMLNVWNEMYGSRGVAQHS